MGKRWETVETVSDFIFFGSKITADGDCRHEIKRRLLLGPLHFKKTLLHDLSNSSIFGLRVKFSPSETMITSTVHSMCKLSEPSNQLKDAPISQNRLFEG